MATFEYDGLTASDRLIRGVIEAGSQQEASELLEQMKLKVNSLEKAKPERPRTAVGRSEFLLFNQQLASLTKAGIPLERGLRELSKDVASRRLRRLIESIATDLEAGVGIEQAFEKRERSFPPLYARLLKAGVQTGRLSEMLTALNRHLEISSHTRRIVFEATAYPAVIFIIGAVITTLVLVFLIPQYRQVLHEMVEGRLNAVTTLVFALSQNIGYFWLAVAVLAGALAAASTFLSSFPEGRRLRESVIFALPAFGLLYRNCALSKMTEAMAMTVAAGCDMPACLRISAGATGSEKIVRESDIIAAHTEQGGAILDAAQFASVIPRFFLYSIQLGAQRNELEDNLRTLSDMYTQQVRCMQVRLQGWLLPVMLIFVGFFIMLAVLAIFLPMMQIVSGLSAG